jgi:hypothetical protein
MFNFQDEVSSGRVRHISEQDDWVEMIKTESLLSGLEAMALYSWLHPTFGVTFL